jgi:exodeoxyribonuclease VII large subunit
MSLMQIAEVGVGDMLAKIEELKRRLADEGLFDSEHKQPLPFLPRVIGLVCGRNAQAKSDVIENVRRRWAGARFEVREVSVGNSPATAREVAAAVQELDAQELVDVIVITRGGCALEEVVFPFSDEGLVRAVWRTRTPVVSAIGHETDRPLLDYVADFRASTPTDAAKNIVPSMAEEAGLIDQLSLQITALLGRRLHQERETLNSVVSRPVLRSPDGIFEPQQRAIRELHASARQSFTAQLQRHLADFAALEGKFRALSPTKTLERGFAIVLKQEKIVTSAKELANKANFTVRFADGDVKAVADSGGSSRSSSKNNR